MGTGPCTPWDRAGALGSCEGGKHWLSVCLEIFLAVCAKMKPPNPEERWGACPPPQQLPGACGHQTRVALGALGLSAGPLSRWLLPVPLRGTVNPLNGLGGNSSSPLLNGSSDAACGALEVAELRPYSGPNHPPTPSQNNNNPSDTLAATGHSSLCALRSGDPLLVQQQCPFVRPACWTGTVNGRFCWCLFSLKKLEGLERGRRKPAGRFMFTSSTWRHLVVAPALPAPRLGARTMGACVAPEGRGTRSAAGRSRRGMEGTPGASRRNFRMAQRKCKFLWLGAAREKQGLVFGCARWRLWAL